MAWLVGWLVSRKRGANPESAMFTIALVGLVTARVGFVLMYSADYQGQFLRMIDIRVGVFLPVIGFFAALFAVVFFAARQPDLLYGLGIVLAVAAAVAVLGLTATAKPIPKP